MLWYVRIMNGQAWSNICAVGAGFFMFAAQDGTFAVVPFPTGFVIKGAALQADNRR
jgi:hypothetical protein